MPDRIDHAIGRMDKVNRRQRRIESIIVAVAIAALAVFQAVSRASLVHSQAVTNKGATVERRLLNGKLDDANRRIQQLTDALVAAGVDVPAPTSGQPVTPPTSTTTSTLFRRGSTTTTATSTTTTTTAPPRSPPPQPSTSTTTQPAPPTPPSTLVCLPVVGCR